MELSFKQQERLKEIERETREAKLPKIVSMTVKVARPPNFAAILAVFPLAAQPNVIFAYGDCIYNPGNIEVTRPLAAHELIHMGQQKGEPAFWWERYLADKQFRLEQELPAHQAEFTQWCLEYPHERKMRRIGLKMMAERLSGPLYCNMLTFERAKHEIKFGEGE